MAVRCSWPSCLALVNHKRKQKSVVTVCEHTPRDSEEWEGKNAVRWHALHAFRVIYTESNSYSAWRVVCFFLKVKSNGIALGQNIVKTEEMPKKLKTASGNANTTRCLCVLLPFCISIGFNNKINVFRFNTGWHRNLNVNTPWNERP